MKKLTSETSLTDTELAELLDEVKLYIEEAEDTMNQESGLFPELKVMIAKGLMPPVYFKVLRLSETLKKTKEQHE